MANRIQAAVAGVTTDIVEVDLVDLGKSISSLIRDVGQLAVVTVEDLRVYGESESNPPADVMEALRWGTKIFDAMYYFALEVVRRPKVMQGNDGKDDLGKVVVLMKKRLLWTALFLMLRGSYPQSSSKDVGTDVPAFLRNICGMTESPASTAKGLASFHLVNVPTGWIRCINWSSMAPAIRQRLSLGIAGYRALGPFRLYPCRPDASQAAKEAHEWVKRVVNASPDYAILSCTRSPTLIAKLGSWNNALGNLTLECFTKDQIESMVDAKILFKVPVRDPRYDTWRTWVAGGDLVLNDPIGL